MTDDGALRRDADEAQAGADDGLRHPRARRRFRRRADDDWAAPGAPRDALEAEVVLLREENARLKAARHQRADVTRLLGRARELAADQIDRQSLTDDTAQMLVDGLVIRESLMEICQEIERTMVAFQARLNALASPAAPDEVSNGHGPAAA